jgi:glutathione synthase/RimK-type ligase-like ATP-grasp enzyme
MRVALTTTPAARDVDEDFAPLARAFRARGLVAEAPCWDDATVNWGGFDVVLLRSTWNYTEDLGAFLGWAGAVSRVTRLFNPPSILTWSTNKRYLIDLESKGVPIVPTEIALPGERWLAPAHGEYVLKPIVGAGSRGAKRFASSDHDEARAHAGRLHAAGYGVLTQPYLHSVDDYGETALLFYDGEFSHAVRKGPLLSRGAGEVQGLFLQEQIEPRSPGADELDVARRAVAAIPFGAPLYARVDLIRGADGTPCVLELELAEPSMFFNYAPGSAERFAARVLLRLDA